MLLSAGGDCTAGGVVLAHVSMKLRILDNTLRFRLSRPEIERFTAGNAVTAGVFFPGSGHLSICLSSDAALVAINVTFDGGRLGVSVPAATARTLCAPEAVTIDQVVANRGGPDLSIKIEKDFRCLMPRDEDESTLFEHPSGS